MQMYGGDAIRDPPPKPVSEEPEVLEEGPAEEGEVPPHTFVSPATTLDVNLVGWDGPDDPENLQK
ncbi:hypothetical protein AN958_06481 [Leucoagaricus sp. SymC.cos]|nr:hypothetical protein AN958_06481 [Leucoagaricus sp. SymC.cos]